MIKTFKTSLTAQVMAGTLASFLLFGCVMAYIGNREVTEAVEEQYVDAAYRTAATALIFLDPEKLADYVGMDDARWAEETRPLADRWNRIAENQDCMLIYAVPVDPGHESIRSSERVDVALSVRSFKAGGISPELKRAWRGSISIRGNRQAYLDILERGQQRAVIIRPQTSVLGPHLTLMVPIKNSGGEIRGILSVQREMDKLVAAQRSHVLDVILGAAALLAVILPLRAWGLQRRVLKPIQTIMRETLRFAKEDTLPAVPLGASVPFSNEIGQLARSIDAMEAENLEHVASLLRVTAEKEQIQAELNVARDIQLSMLPVDFALRPGIDLFATMDAAKEVGGDFYDFYVVDGERVAVTIADVSGKGVPAALFMVVAKTVLKNFISSSPDEPGALAEAVSRANRQLCQNNESMMFVTVFTGILNTRTGIFTYVNAGHNPPLRSIAGRFEYLPLARNGFLGISENIQFKEDTLTLSRGDGLFLYTDGLTEAEDVKKELFGNDRLLDALNAPAGAGDMDARELLEYVKGKAGDFVKSAPQSDDLTMLYMRCVQFYKSSNARPGQGNSEEDGLTYRTPGAAAEI